MAPNDSALTRLWALRAERPLFVAATMVTIGALLVYPVVDWWLRAVDIAPGFQFWDFGAYGGAVERSRTGDPLYVRSDGGGFHGSYLYPPVVVLLFWPFVAMFPAGQSAIVWVGVSVALLWIGLQLLASVLGLPLRWWERGLLLWLLVGFQPLLLSVKMGQTATFLTALLCFAFVALAAGNRDGSPWVMASGGLTALVGVIKPSYAPVGAHLLSDRFRLLGAVLTGAVVGILSLVAFGVGTHWTYLDVLRWGIEQGEGGRPPTLWLPPYYRPLAWLSEPMPLRFVVSLVIAGYAVSAPPEADRTVFALGVAAFPLLSPLTYTYYLVALLPATAILLAVELDLDGRPAIPVIGLLLVHVHAYGLRFLVVELPPLVPSLEALEPHYLLLQPGLWGNLLLLGLAAVRVGEAVTVPVWIRRRIRKMS